MLIIFKGDAVLAAVLRILLDSMEQLTSVLILGEFCDCHGIKL